MKEISKNYSKRIDTREELLERLNLYKGILSDHVVEYLNSIIELDFSVLKEYLSIEEINSLSELDIYKRAAIYNIYNRALKIVQKNSEKLKIYGNEYGVSGLNIFMPLKAKNARVFSYNYGESPKIREKVPEGYTTKNLGNISLYQVLENDSLRQIELERIMKKLENLYDESKNLSFLEKKNAAYVFALTQEIERYERMFTELDSRHGLTDEEKVMMETTNIIHDAFLDDYSLSHKKFDDERGTISNISLSGKVNGNKYVTGINGKGRNGKILNVILNVDVTGKEYTYAGYGYDSFWYSRNNIILESGNISGTLNVNAYSKANVTVGNASGATEISDADIHNLEYYNSKFSIPIKNTVSQGNFYFDKDSSGNIVVKLK